MAPAPNWPPLPGIVTYFGGKGGEGTSQQIINQIRPHEVYVELFAGSGQVMRHLAPGRRVGCVANDLDGAVMQAWQQAAYPGVELRQKQALALLTELVARYPVGCGLRVVVYADPPYPFCSRKNKSKRYGHEMRDDEHPILLKALRKLPAHFDVLISTYPNPIYAEHLADWRLVQFTSQTRSGSATEYLYCNYDSPQALHDSRYVGQNYRERERIRKLKKRWKARFEGMSPEQRQAVLEILLESTSAPAHLVLPPAPAVPAATTGAGGTAAGAKPPNKARLQLRLFATEQELAMAG